MRRLVRTAFTLLLVVCVSLLLCEAVVRAYFAILVGPRLLLYGTPWHRDQLASSVTAAAREQNLLQVHRNDVGGYRSYAGGDSGAYSKYFPHEAKVGLGPGGERFDVRINNHGFRGGDFAVAKPPGVIRVVTLGASSTFGYSNRDDETYPHRLEQILNERGGGRRFEVINIASRTRRATTSWHSSARRVSRSLRTGSPSTRARTTARWCRPRRILSGSRGRRCARTRCSGSS
ncbi:MAG: hypothetical protein FJ144_07275 [Deltaproteobacteria bacterium]|nr:hypothetical protein [Deltaproteobacteria bacterium]